jgi:GH25 family lysozyme M1 (1,4-beta-N-acetylmuramidase)
MKLGVDVSKWNGKIDWSKVKRSYIDFAMIRSSYGKKSPTQIDKKFKENVVNAQSQGIGCGAYHYTYADSKQDAIDEAHWFLENLNGTKLEYPVALDIEDRMLASLSNEQRSEICRVFCEEVERHGFYVSIYCNCDWFLNKINGEKLSKKFDFWIAKWGKSRPSCPHGMWQYSSSGKVDGILGFSDLNYAYKDYPTIIKGKNLNNF